MSIRTVIKKEKIHDANNIESVLLDNFERCIVSKNVFDVGSEGFYLKNGLTIDLNLIDDFNSIKFISDKDKNDKNHYKIKEIVYRSQVYDGILFSLKDRTVEDLKKLIVKKKKEKKESTPNPNQNDQNPVTTSIPSVGQDMVCLGKHIKDEIVEKFFDEHLYILKYMKGGLHMTIDGLKIYSKHSQVTDKTSVYLKMAEKLYLNNFPYIFYGKIYKGQFYVINIADKKTHEMLTCKETIEVIKKYSLNSGLIGFYEEKFFKKNDLKNLLFANKYINDKINNGKSVDDYVIVRNDQGSILKIKNRFFDKLFFNLYNFYNWNNKKDIISKSFILQN